MRTLLKQNIAAAIVAILGVTMFYAPLLSRDFAQLASSCDRDDDDDDDLGDAMERVHKGRRSPYRKIRIELEAAAPNFAELQLHVPALIKMSEQLKKSRNADVSGSADGYVAAVRDLATAVQKRQTLPAQAAFKALGNSCGDCHYRGGPGGKLD